MVYTLYHNPSVNSPMAKTCRIHKAQCLYASNTHGLINVFWHTMYKGMQEASSVQSVILSSKPTILLCRLVMAFFNKQNNYPAHVGVIMKTSSGVVYVYNFPVIFLNWNLLLCWKTVKSFYIITPASYILVMACKMCVMFGVICFWHF